MDLDHEQLAKEMVRALRGARSQEAFARRLGVVGHTVYSWEAGRRWPRGAELFRLADRTGLDVMPNLSSFLRRPVAELEGVPGTAPWIAAMLRDLRGHTPIQALADRIGRSRYAVSRWLSGKAQPRLPDLLRMVDGASLRLLDFVACFLPPASLPSVAAHWEQTEAARDLAWNAPWAQVVLLGLELQAYRALPRHDDGWLADRLGLPASVVEGAMDQLIAAGQIRAVGGLFAPVEVLSVDLRRATSRTSLKRHWAQVGLDRMEGGEGLYAYNVFTVSEETLVALRDLQRAHYRAVRTLISASEEADRVVLMNLQLVPLDERTFDIGN